MLKVRRTSHIFLTLKTVTSLLRHVTVFILQGCV